MRFKSFAVAAAVALITCVSVAVAAARLDIGADDANAHGALADTSAPLADPNRPVILPEVALSSEPLRDADRRSVASEPDRWSLDMSSNDGQLCLHLVFTDGAGGAACGLPREMPELGVIVIGDAEGEAGAGKGARFLVAFARDELSRLNVGFADGRNTVVEARRHPDIPVSAFIVEVDEGADVVTVSAEDDAGNVVEVPDGLPRDL